MVVTQEVSIFSDKNLPFRFTVNVFNEAMTPLWTSKVVVPKFEKVYQYLKRKDFIVLNDGRVIGISIKKEFAPKPSTTFIDLIVPSPNSEHHDTYSINFGEKGIHRLRVRPLDSGDFIITGLYENDESSHYMDGLAFIKVDGQTYEPKIKKFSAFSEEDYQNIFPSKIAKKAKGYFAKKWFLLGLVPKAVVLRDDEGIALITEHGSGEQSNEIIVFSMSPQGEFDFIQKIGKKQVDYELKDTGLGSFGLMVKDDKLNFIYNDNIKNLDIPISGEPSILSNKASKRFIACPVFLVSLSTNGSTSKKLLLNKKDIPRQAVCYKLQQISDDVGIFYLVDRDHFNLVKVTFK